MKRIIDVLMDRDGYTEEEALGIIKEVQDMVLFTQDTSIMEDELGLEPDYLVDLFEY